MATEPARVLRAEWSGPARIGPLRLHAGNASVEFAIGVLGLLTVRGRFAVIEGELTFDEANLSRTSLRARVPVAAIRTGNRMRDAHLRSRRWFDASAHPFVELEAGTVERGAHDLLVHGIVRIKDVAAPVRLSCVTRPRPGARPELLGTGRLSRAPFALGPPPPRLARWDPRAYLVEDAVHLSLRLTLDG